MPRYLLTLAAALAIAAGTLAVPALAQPSPTLAGHWEGKIETPGEGLAIVIDFFPAAEGKWEGAITIPAQSVKGLPLSGITLKGTTAEFGMQAVPGAPRFSGTLSPDGKVLSGDFSQGGGTVPFTLAWKSEAKREVIPPSTPVTKELEGSWEGSLAVGSTTLRLVLKLSNTEGRGVGSIVSLDQGGMEIPIASVQQNASHVKLDVRVIAASFEGDLKDGQIVGTWSQGPGSLPLTFTRPAAPPK